MGDGSLRRRRAGRALADVAEAEVGGYHDEVGGTAVRSASRSHETGSGGRTHAEAAGGGASLVWMLEIMREILGKANG